MAALKQPATPEVQGQAQLAPTALPAHNVTCGQVHSLSILQALPFGANRHNCLQGVLPWLLIQTADHLPLLVAGPGGCLPSPLDCKSSAGTGPGPPCTSLTSSSELAQIK